jgi:hypothetical protein
MAHFIRSGNQLLNLDYVNEIVRIEPKDANGLPTYRFSTSRGVTLFEMSDADFAAQISAVVVATTTHAGKR